ncbi:MAG: NUDIX domain-containing protein [Bacteroidales bacterium]|nr:NUDIX domain-containing protein [Bacteroidales bacterium]
MHKIYFEKRCLAVCSPQEQALSDPNAVRWQGGEAGEGIPELVRFFRASAHLPRVLVPTEDPEGVYRAVCAQFREVNAAGGLVSNRRGDVLLIRRDSLWDLPKGHQEAGEDIETTALREVQEETGVDRLVLRGLLCITDHCYLRDGVWHLKHTWWFDMLYTDPVDLTPQREENISLAAWVARSSLAPYLKNTYPSIVEVFREAKI